MPLVELNPNWSCQSTSAKNRFGHEELELARYCAIMIAAEPLNDSFCMIELYPPWSPCKGPEQPSLGFGDLVAEHLTDSRRGKNMRFPLLDLLRQSVYRRTAGDEDVNVATRLWQKPAIRLSGSEKIGRRGAWLSSRLQSFETDLPLQDGNLAWFATINPELR